MPKDLDITTPLFAGKATGQRAVSVQEATGDLNPRLPFSEFISGGRLNDQESSLRTLDRSSQAQESPASSSLQTVTRFGLRLVCEGQIPYRSAIRCDQPESAARFLHKVLEGIDREVLGAIYLDGRHKVIGHTIAYVGTLTHAPVEPRGVLVPALLANAQALILFHNHPSGETDPSADDQQLTKRLVKAGDLLGIKVLDHIILGEAPRFLSLFTRNPW